MPVLNASAESVQRPHTAKLNAKMEFIFMRLAVNRYSVVIKGTNKTPFYYGYKTQREAREMRDKLNRVTGSEHEIKDSKTGKIIA